MGRRKGSKWSAEERARRMGKLRVTSCHTDGKKVMRWLGPAAADIAEALAKKRERSDEVGGTAN